METPDIQTEDISSCVSAKEKKSDEREEPEGNFMPEKAAQVFHFAATRPLSPSRRSEAFWGMATGTQGYEGPEDTPQATDGRGCPSRDIWKVGVSLMTSAIFFPFLIWGGFVFLPFDAPLLVGAPLRLVYALRCSVFAATPVILGWLVLGVSRLRFGLVRPSLDDGEDKQQPEGVGLHRSFTSDSVALFLLHFLQLVVMAMYLRQEHLKLVPLLAIVFALGRLAYWVAAAFGSSVRGFGFGLTFLPILVMATTNMVFIYAKEPSWIFRLHPNMEVLALPTSRQRFWG
ncbi:transmembrane protein 79-like isoform X1 [Nerophis lumbriciformis]|uniref:transmembrane protein 79-like isoform X1 n=1 Tax=Nerophis lumbriciformis TaxID=546530 RepID=UPI002AE0816C|nr:transmembrane protein 79-like isoform X1 [Nerophis lumbriciformis]XP_061838981.1 transmembrane protein 79-like isoform X1 [Nerophis lumbriciformis]